MENKWKKKDMESEVEDADSRVCLFCRKFSFIFYLKTEVSDRSSDSSHVGNRSAELVELQTESQNYEHARKSDH